MKPKPPSKRKPRPRKPTPPPALAAKTDERAERIARIMQDPTIGHIANRLARGMAQGDAAEPTKDEMDFGLAMFTRLLRPTPPSNCYVSKWS